MDLPTIITGLPLIFSTIVAESAMHLPPMTRPQDTAFILRMTEVLIDAFWQNYVAELPTKAYDDLVKAEKEESGEKAKQWSMTYANFADDAEAQKRAEKILDELRGKFPRVLQAEYERFTEDDAAAL